MKKNEEDNQYMKNHESAQKVGLHMLGGCMLHGFDPGWSFIEPKWLSKLSSTIQLPDFVVGILAERMGLHWEWGKGDEAHPLDQLTLYIRSLNKRHERDKEEISNLFMLLDKYTEKETDER